MADGWRHIYLDCGNHIAVKKELYYAVKDIFYRKDNCDITFEWPNMLKEASFAEKMDASAAERVSTHVADACKEYAFAVNSER